MERWRVRCSDFDHRSTTWVIAGDAYGRLLGRTHLMELAECSAWEDHDFYDGVKKLIEELLPQARWTGHCLRQVLGWVCDPAPSGESYDFAGRLWCPACGTPNLAEYGPYNPGQFDEVDLPLVTYDRWTHLTRAEREHLLLDVLGRMPL